MTSKKGEKLKLYVVIGLLCIAVIVAYFRFGHKKSDAVPKIVESPPQEVKFDVSQLQKPVPPKRVFGRRSPVDESLNTDIRDIFSIQQLPTMLASQNPLEGAPAPTGILKLKGTIIGGATPMAIINDQFIQLGEKIGEYQIVAIDPNQVILKSGSHEKVLQVLTPADK